MSGALWQQSATALATLYRSGDTTPPEVAQACLERLEVVNPQLNAVIARRDAAFLQEARNSAARYAAGCPLSALDGVPITVKDSLYTRDLPTTWGTRALRDWCTGEDELAVARARAAGALILGKTNVPEFALEGYTANPLFGVTGNPWNPALTPGGSSGGAVAAVAAGIGPLAIGQDGGGSIRRPASHAGIVGLKPSLSAVPREHVLPSLLLDFEVIGPLARTVADARMLFDVVRGPDPGERASLSAAWAAAQPHSAGRLRVLYVERVGMAPLDPEVARSVGQAVETLARLGHHVRAGALPLDLEFFVDAWPQIGQIGLARLFEQNPQWGRLASARYTEMAELGRRIPAARLWQIIDQVRQLRRQANVLFTDVDVVAMPSAAALAWLATDAFPAVIDDQPVGPRGHAVYTGWVNAAGLPAVALPCAPSRAGLPIGMQLIGRYGADAQLLDLGTAFENAQPWSHRWPDL